MTRSSIITIARWSLVAAVIIFLAVVGYLARATLVPFVIGLIFAYLVLPVVDLLDRRLPRSLAILIVYALFLGLLAGIFAYVGPPIIHQFQSFGENLPDQLAGARDQFNQWVDTYRRLDIPPDLRQSIENGLTDAGNAALAEIRNRLVDLTVFLLSTVSFLIGLVVVPVWLFYVMKDRDRIRRGLNGLMPEPYRVDGWNIVRLLDRVLRGYVRGQAILAILIWIAATAGLLALGVPYAWVLGMFAGALEVVPFLGPILGAIPAVIVGFVDSPWTGLQVIILFVVIQQLENAFLQPRIVGTSVGLHPALVMLVLTVAGAVFGFVGLIVAAPLTAIGRDLFLYIHARLTGMNPEEAFARASRFPHAAKPALP